MCCQGLGRCDLAHDVVFALTSASLSLPRAGRCIRASFRATVLRHLLTSTRVSHRRRQSGAARSTSSHVGKYHADRPCCSHGV